MWDNSRQSVISLCSGAGGLDIGLADAGWTILCQIESDRNCIDTLNSHKIYYGSQPQTIHAKLEQLDPGKLRRSLGLRRGELGMIAGGPPCQPFTTHGKRKGIKDARVASLFPKYLEYVREFRPHCTIIENVDGILSAALRHRPLVQRGRGNPHMLPDEMKGSFLRWLVDSLYKLGYSVSWGVLDAIDYGVPQFRQRAFIIGIQDVEPCYLPNGDQNQDISKLTLRHALRGLNDPGSIQPLSEYKKSIFGLIPPGGNWRNLPPDLQAKTMGKAYQATGGKSGWWRRLAWDRPSPTILGMPDHSSTGLIHPDEVRCLGLFECAAIQTFPPDLTFSGSPRSQYQQVGNAVPPLLGREIGFHVSQHLRGHRQPRPSSPKWRQSSSNRRIGTHGWLVANPKGPLYELVVKVRDDHIWAHEHQFDIFSNAA